MYTDFFGESSNECTEIIDSRDFRAVDDCCAWIHFKTCPKELSRILSKVPYTASKMHKDLMKIEFKDPALIDENIVGTDPPKWWSIMRLGDSCLKFEYRHSDEDRMQIAYVSMDSTEIFYNDATW